LFRINGHHGDETSVVVATGNIELSRNSRSLLSYPGFRRSVLIDNTRRISIFRRNNRMSQFMCNLFADRYLPSIRPERAALI
jgi:hypothetical protein